LRALNVDFAPPRRWPAAILWATAAMLFGLAGFVTTADMRRWQALTADRDRTADLRAQLDSQRASQAMLAASASQPPTYAVDARHRMALSAFDSAGVLRSVESAQIPGAKVTSLEIDAESRRVQLELEVTGADVAAAYLLALNAGLDRPQWTLSRLQVLGGVESALISGQVP
jgi:hypothetical protein